MRKKPLLSILRKKTGQEQKVKLKVYKLQGTLAREFSNIEQAREFATSGPEKYPGLLFEPYLERRSAGNRREVLDRRKKTDRRNGAERRTSRTGSG
jgi:hypothetical protein